MMMMMMMMMKRNNANQNVTKQMNQSTTGEKLNINKIIII